MNGSEQKKTMGKIFHFPGNNEKRERKVKQNMDYSILIVISILVCFGLVMVFSASYYTAEDSVLYDSGSSLFQKQLFGAIVGAALMIVFSKIDYHVWTKLRFILLAAGFLALLAIFIPGIGVELNGSTRWINVGIQIQPSEPMKFALIVFMASSLSRYPAKITGFVQGLLPYLVLLGAIAFLIMKQPNLSAVICITGLMLVMLIVAGADLKIIGGIAGAGVLGFIILALSDQYRRDRLLAFTDPFKYASDEGYQVVQSLYAIGTGGFFGLGLGNSIQKKAFLTYSESDFIFAIITEELGFLGAIVLIGLFIFFIWRAVRVAVNAPDMLGMMLATGVTAIIAIQVIVHIAVVTSSIPATGVALPFISYGSSGLIIFMAMIGILLNVSRWCKKA